MSTLAAREWDSVEGERVELARTVSTRLSGGWKAERGDNLLGILQKTRGGKKEAVWEACGHESKN